MSGALRLKCIAHGCREGTVSTTGRDEDCPACAGRGWAPFPAYPEGPPREEVAATGFAKIAEAIFDEMSVSDGVEYHVAERFARAALKAMRDPPESQLRAAWERAHCEIDTFWRAYVDFLLDDEARKGREEVDAYTRELKAAVYRDVF
jgi:hypothetical protein